MFSSLLPRPKHSDYRPSIFLAQETNGQKQTQALRTLVAPGLDQETVISNPSDLAGTISKLHLNPDGTLNYNLTIASAANGGSRKVQASYEDTIPLKKRFPNLKHHFPRYNLKTCPDDSLKTCVRETKDVINGLINAKLHGTTETKVNDSQIVNYQSSSVLNDNEDRGRVILIRSYEEDPMLPPKFKLRKNRHKDPSPPPPILKNTTANDKKLTKEERAAWNIPSAISNWKNNQGFTIALDKRMMAANGGSELQGPEVNIEKFGDLSSALETAERDARDELKIRNEKLKELAIKEKQEQQLKLRELAELTRAERAQQGKRQYGYDNDNHKRKKYP